MVERAGQSRVRHHREQQRLGVLLGRQQPREPDHAVRQRPADGPDRRSDLPPGRRPRHGVERDARAAAAARRQRTLDRSSRGGRHALPPCHLRCRTGAGGLRVAGRSGEAVAPDRHQHIGAARAPHRVRLCRVVPGAPAQRRTALGRHRRRPRAGHDRDAEQLQHRVRRPRVVLSRERCAGRLHGRPHRVRRARSHVAGAGGAVPEPVDRPRRRRSGSLRRAPDLVGTRAGRDEAAGVRPGSGARPRSGTRNGAGTSGLARCRCTRRTTPSICWSTGG